MTEVLHSPTSSSSSVHNFQSLNEEEGMSGGVIEEINKNRDTKETDQLSLLALLVTLFRKSFWVACKTDKVCGGGMEIGWPSNVRHVAHVTFDRFNGFLGLPVEFEPEVPTRAPSASTTVFGVSTESMQLSFDPRGNSVPTILLQMQQRLYAQGGLQAEGIFRINAENSQEEFVRNQLNAGVVPEGIDLHCLAGLIKAWFRELPSGVLDTLSYEQVMQCQSEEECAMLASLLPPTEAALLDWAINLMADVVQQENLNKMNAHNIAMVFAPNMTQMADPLNALMYAVQVMNFLKTLIARTLKARKDFVVESSRVSHMDPSDENGRQGPPKLQLEEITEENEETEQALIAEDPDSKNISSSVQVDNSSDEEYLGYSNSAEESDGDGYSASCTSVSSLCSSSAEATITSAAKVQVEQTAQGDLIGQSCESNEIKFSGKTSDQKIVVQAFGPLDKSKGISNLSRINIRSERIESWL